MMKRTRISQSLAKEEKENLVYKLEPYLKAGLSIRTACLLSGVSRATLYKIMDEDENLRVRIDQFRVYMSVLISTAFSRKLHIILAKQQKGLDIVGEDLEFIKWLALNSVHCRDEFGRSTRSTTTYDPEFELRRIFNLIDEKCNNIEYSIVEA